MANLNQLLNDKKQFLIYTFANLIVQLGITYYVMEKKEITKDSISLKKFFYVILFFQLVTIIVLVAVPMPIWLKFILFSMFSISFGVILSFIKKKIGEDIIKISILGTISIFVVMFSIGTFLLMSGIKLGYKTGIFLFYSLLLLIITQLFSLFTKSNQNVKILTFISLIIFSGYIIYDTNKILQRNYSGDFIRASMDYYLDIMNIFIDLVKMNDN
jgi:modulator of FtsH protease